MEVDGDGIQFTGTLRRLGGDRGLFQELAAFYREDSPALLQEVKTGIEAGNIPQIQRAVHRLRSMLENFDAERAVAITRTMEQTCRRGELPVTSTALTQLEEDMQSLDAALSRYIDAPGDGNSRNGGLRDANSHEPAHAVRRAC